MFTARVHGFRNDTRFHGPVFMVRIFYPRVHGSRAVNMGKT